MNELSSPSHAGRETQAIGGTDPTVKRHVDPFRSAALLLFLLALAASGIRPADRFVWLSQCMAPLLGLMLLLAFRRRYLPSRTGTCLLLLQGLLLLTGAHYGFQNIPFFRFRMSDGSMRACVDWLTHFVDGLVYARITYELYAAVRTPTRNGRIQPTAIRTHGMPGLLAVCASLALAALWELTEWIACIATQDRYHLDGGYAADTQMDMLLTLLGALALVAADGAACAWKARFRNGRQSGRTGG